MKCDNKICIYQKNGQCINGSEIEVDWRRLCKNMTPARITADALDNSKFYSGVILECGDYYFDNETGKYIRVNRDLMHKPVD